MSFYNVTDGLSYYLNFNASAEDSVQNVTNISIFEDRNEFNDTFPVYLQFNENSLWTVLVYSVLFFIAAIGNLTVFVSLFKSRHRKSRISLMIRHLAIADLVVTFIMIPIEVSDFKLSGIGLDSLIYISYLALVYFTSLIFNYSTGMNM